MGIDFMRLFPLSFGFVYILVLDDYVSKWVQALAIRTNDHRIVVKLWKSLYFINMELLELFLALEVVTFVIGLSTLFLESILWLTNYNNNSQCGSHFYGVWGDPTVSNLTSTGIPSHREADSRW